MDTIKDKTISTRSAELLAHFNGAEQFCFTVGEAQAVLSGSKPDAVRRLLSDMTRRGLLLRLKEGLYHVIPYEKDPDTFVPDWHLVAGCLAGDVDHYIGYYSALQIHSLITQPSLREQIVVNRQLKPAVLTVKDVPFQFIYHNTQHFFGAKSTWVDSYNKVRYSDLEKTFVDCLFKPDYGGGIGEIAKALFKSREKLDYGKLLDYARRFGSQAVVKRLGFLLELLEVNHPAVEELHKLRTDAVVLLEPSYAAQGRILSRWSLRQNVDTEPIVSSLTT